VYLRKSRFQQKEKKEKRKKLHNKIDVNMETKKKGGG